MFRGFASENAPIHASQEEQYYNKKNQLDAEILTRPAYSPDQPESCILIQWSGLIKYIISELR